MMPNEDTESGIRGSQTEKQEEKPLILASFDIHGAPLQQAEHIRLLLEFTGTKYVDKIYPRDKDPKKRCWIGLKEEIGSAVPELPYLMDGGEMVQSDEIMRHIGRKHNMSGEMEDEMKSLKKQAVDFRNSFLEGHSDLDKLKPEYLDSLPDQLKQFSDCLGNNMWFAGDSITFVDFIMYEVLDQHRMFQITCLDDFQNLKDLMDRFETLDKISAYMKSDRYKKNPVGNSSSNLCRATILTPEEFSQTPGFRFLHQNMGSIKVKQKDAKTKAKQEDTKMHDIKKLTMSTNPDVMILTETWLKNFVGDSVVDIDGYNIFRCERCDRGDGSTRGGGVAIYVKNTFKVTEIKSKSAPKQYELLVLKVELMEDCIITVVGCYRPPSAPSETLCSLVATMSKIKYEELVLAGDLNWNWLSHESDLFKNFCDSAGLTQIIRKPTRPNPKNPEKSTLIDLFLTNAPQRFTATAVFDCNDRNIFPKKLSDHHAIAAVRDTNLQPRYVSKESLKALSERAFLESLKMCKWTEVLKSGAPEVALKHFQSSFLDVTDKHAPFSLDQSLMLSNETASSATENRMQPDVSENSETDFRTITVKEVRKALRDIDPKKPVGPDGLDPYFIQIAASHIAKPLAHIFNLTLKSGRIPDIWKVVHITPLLEEDGDPADLRHILIHSVLANVLEALVSKHLKEFLLRKGKLNDLQSGFGEKHSKVTATLKVLNDIICALDSKKHCAALFIDLLMPFKAVDHSVLLWKLSNTGLSRKMIQWFKNFLHGRTQSVQNNGVTSRSVTVQKGIPQGSPLGTILLAVYIDDLCADIKDAEFHFYQDNVIIYSSALSPEHLEKNLQSAFDVVQMKLCELHLSLNTDKTKMMCFSIQKKSNQYKYRISTSDRKVIQQVPTYEYLGFVLEENLSFSHHIDRLTEKLTEKLQSYRQNQYNLSFKAKKKLIQELLSEMDQGDILYMHANLSYLKKLDALYKQMLQFICCSGSRRDVSKKVGWPPLRRRRLEHWYMFLYKVVKKELPSYLCSLLTCKASTGHGLRSDGQILFNIPGSRTKFGKKAFKVDAPSTWSELQKHFQLEDFISEEDFEERMKALPSSYFER